ncbi:MAG: flagellar hook capping FlgD N-terminal domain-containing protein [Bryobacteraceae bacterium]
MNVKPAATPADAPVSNPAPKPGTSKSVTESDFLTLLVAQMKNQDPTNPTDSTAFVTQLAQFSQLEQVIGIRNDIEAQIAKSEVPVSATGEK